MATYELLWRNKHLTARCRTIDDFIAAFEAAAATMRRWKEAGIVLEAGSGIADDYATFTTTDPKLAKAEGFEKRDV
jgi:hypothetical protein